MRLDLWLWAVRAYKTRSRAVSAIKNGRVEIGGVSTKPSRLLKAGELITLRIDTDVTIWKRSLCVIGMPPSRVGAKLVPLYAEDQTPPEELEKARLRAGAISGYRARGTGRPTKRERRDLDGVREGDFEISDVADEGGGP